MTTASKMGLAAVSFRRCSLRSGRRIAVAQVAFGLALVGVFGVVSPARGAVTVFGGTGPGVGHFTEATGIAVESDGSVVVSDRFSSDLLHYANDGTYLSTVGSTGSGTSPLQFQGPHGIAVDPSGNVLVADTGNLRVDVLSPSLSYVRSVSLSSPPYQVAADASAIYVLSDGSTNLVLSKFANDASLTPEGTHVIAYGSGSDQMAHPIDIEDQMAVDAAGDVLIADATNQRVVTYSSSLSFIRAWSESGNAAGLAIGTYAGGEQVYVGDWGPFTNPNGARVLRGDALGHQEGSFGPTHFGSLYLQPWALATDSAGDVFAADEGNRILRIAPTPDPAFTATPSSSLTSQAVAFDGSSSSVPFWAVNDFHWDLDGSGQFATDGGASPTVSKRFDQPGTYTIGLQVDTTNGQSARTTVNYVVGNSGAAFKGPGQALTNTAATFDGTPSVIPYSSVADYAWDFDRSGSYAIDGGTTPTISHTFPTPGTYAVQLRVTRVGGRIDFASGTIIVTPLPPPGPEGVSINGGDYATNSPNVTVDLVWPSSAGQVVLSNDGGFGSAGGTMTLPLSTQVHWTLAQTGPERLPKTIYVRFLGAGIDTQNFTDDMILDQTAPTLQSAQLVGGASASASAARVKPKTHSYKITIKAKDKIAGICAVSASPQKSGGTVVTVKNCHAEGIHSLGKTVTIKATIQPRYVRVRNSAGDWSRWLRMK